MVKHNNVVPNVHLRKHWLMRVRTYFDQPQQKRRRNEKRAAKAQALFPRPIEKLRPVVRGQTQRYNKSSKLGRGFTLLELREAGLGQSFAQSIGVRVDHRRRNKSQESLDANTKRLKAYIKQLILYPKNEKFLKKGPVPDTKDAPKEAQQVDNPAVIPFSRIIKREKPQAITKALKESKVYRVLRQEMTNKKWKGLRDKKAKEAQKD